MTNTPVSDIVLAVLCSPEILVISKLRNTYFQKNQVRFNYKLVLCACAIIERVSSWVFCCFFLIKKCKNYLLNYHSKLLTCYKTCMLYRDFSTLHIIHFQKVCGNYGKKMVMKESIARHKFKISLFLTFSSVP